MSLFQQNILVAGVVAVAAFFVARKLAATFGWGRGGRPGCGCSDKGCPRMDDVERRIRDAERTPPRR